MKTRNQRLICRREFVKESGVAITCGMLLQLLESCGDNSSSTSPDGFNIDLTDPTSSALTTVGGAIVKNGIVVIRTSADVYVALSNRCTHQACTVDYKSSNQQLVCPCHGSRFDNNGDVVQGPAAKALSRYAVSVSGNILAVNTNTLI
ncbi:MAG TPA: Rieske (2Fe-2S) protein [Cyclobacteriaceae bacterium]|nr:Rieske (2Fe-2S) protein [Cyclobacteriaceae bacterium]